jgi:hypothetical protein
MFAPLTTEINDRFAAINSFFLASRDFKGDLAATAKGIVFVLVYAAYEFTVTGVTQTTIDEINSRGYRMKELTPSLMALFLDPEFMSLRDASQKNLWRARLKIFERTFADDLTALSNTTGPPSDASHYRHTHLEMIFSVFGIRGRPTRRKQHLFRIDEIVNHRNQIAHGSETAAAVGRRYTRDEVRQRIRQMESVCLFLVSAFDRFCADPARHKRA